MASNHIEIKQEAGAIGATIGGVDLREDLSDNVIGEIRQALLDHLVIFIRDQEITPQQQLDFVQRFGEPDIYPFVTGLDGFPMITPILKKEDETVNFGGLWHADTVYLEHPPMGTVLYAKELPPFGGDTLFANQYLAYEALSKPLRDLLDGLTGINSAASKSAMATRQDRVDEFGTGMDPDEAVAEHPAVRTHPETGRKSLFVNGAHTTGFKELSDEESAPILQFIFRHQVRPEFCCRFRWQPGSLAFWDNRATQHNPVNDYHGHRRLLHRITIKGDKPQ